MRLFSTPEGDAGFALKGDDIVSVFKHPNAPYRHVTRSMLDLAVGQGGRRLDAFDTVLPRFYSQSGFRAVARTPFNDEYRPEGWKHETFKEHNGGRPDVVFMAHDPQAGLYQPWDGARIADYDEGAKHQDAALAEVARRGPHTPAQPGPEAYGSGQLIRMAQPLTVHHGTPHEFAPTRANPLGEFDISKLGTGEGAQAFAYGPYVAGNEKVAEGYRDDLSGGVTYQGRKINYNPNRPDLVAVDSVAEYMQEFGLTPEEAIQRVLDDHEGRAAQMSHPPTYGRTDAWEANQRLAQFSLGVVDAVRRLNPADFAHDKGNLYEAELHIHPDHLLDWDKPLEQHSPYVQERLRDVTEPFKGIGHQTGEFVHGVLVHPEYGQGNKAEAAQELLRRGIPGIRYADANSRKHVEEAYQIRRNAPFSPLSMDESERRAREAESKITHNFVVFDPRTINVVKRNGLPAMVAAGADALREHKKGTP